MLLKWNSRRDLVAATETNLFQLWSHGCIDVDESDMPQEADVDESDMSQEAELEADKPFDHEMTLG